ncbi:MAG: hypothetical protein II881_04375 [Oscillospiraceae bacterium]|nr:hypothetical protein [Oscillospiraceae bacterium]
MPKFEVFYPGEKPAEKPPEKPAASAPEPKKRIRVAVWQGGRLVECKKRDKNTTL